MASDSDSESMPDLEGDSIDTNEHDVAIIDVSRYSINSDDINGSNSNNATVSNDESSAGQNNTNATLNTNEAPEDIIVDLPEIDTRLGDTIDPSADDVDDIADGLDDVDLGNDSK